MTTATTPITNPNVTRSRLVLEIASEMAGGTAADAVPDYILPKVVLQHSRGGEPARFSAVSSAEGIFAVAAREIDLAMINPAAMLSVALRGQGIFKKPMPVRAIAVIPSWDAFVFAVRPETGLARFEDIAARKPKLRILMRATPDHSLHHMFDDVAAAAGFSRHDIARWGGEVRKTGSVPWPYTDTFKALIRGEVDAIFDEAAHSWVPQALDAGITILPLAEATVAKLEATGYRRAVLPRSAYPKLPHDVLSLDFSGWTVFVHAEADDDVGDADLRRPRCAQGAHSVGGARRSAGRAHGARSARHAAMRAAASGRGAFLAQPRLSLMSTQLARWLTGGRWEFARRGVNCLFNVLLSLLQRRDVPCHFFLLGSELILIGSELFQAAPYDGKVKRHGFKLFH